MCFTSYEASHYAVFSSLLLLSLLDATWCHRHFHNFGTHATQKQILYCYVVKALGIRNNVTALRCIGDVMVTSFSSIVTTTLSWVSACSTIVEHSQQEGFTEWRCQRHVKTPTWRRTRDLRRSNFRHRRPPASEATLANTAEEGGTMGEKWPREFCRKWRIPRHFWALLQAVKHDMGQTALLPLRRKACWGLFPPKNPTASAGFELANLGTEGQHATSRPPKPLCYGNISMNIRVFKDNWLRRLVSVYRRFGLSCCLYI
jgi:hypothetical protein